MKRFRIVYRYVLMSLLLSVGAGRGLAQGLAQQADEEFDKLAYAQAVPLYEQALTQVESAAEGRALRAKLAYSYRQLRDSKNAERVYRELMSTGDLPPDYAQCYLYYAQALAMNSNYREAQEAYEKYNNRQKIDQRGPQFSKLYRNVNALTEPAGRYRVEWLPMNTRQAEFSPVYYKNGLVFVGSGKPGKGSQRVFRWNNTSFLDLFYLPEQPVAAAPSGSLPTRPLRTLGRDEYTAPTSNDTRTVGFVGSPVSVAAPAPAGALQPLGRAINSRYHEGPATFTKDGGRVYFTRNNYSNGQYRQSLDGINKLKIFTAEQVDGDWAEPEELPFNSDEYSTGHPALGPDDRWLVFASDRPGGFGGTDLYVTRRERTGWSKPVNLGKAINSAGNELFPFVDAGGTLYFSSDGHPGLGGLDLFVAQLDGLVAQGIRNLGEPFNSPQEDFGLITNNDRSSGYFSSNRKNGGSDDDLYRFTRLPSATDCRELTVRVTDAQTRRPLVGTAVRVEGDTYGNAPRLLATDSTGYVRLCLTPESNVQLLASLDGYADNRVGFSTAGWLDNGPSRLELALTPAQTAAPEAPLLRGQLTTQHDRQPVADALVVLTNTGDGSRQQTTTGPDGTYAFAVQPGGTYTLDAVKKNMGTLGARIENANPGTLPLTLFQKGDIVRLPNIDYDAGSFAIRPETAVELDRLVELLTKYPRMRVEIRSHTDSRGSAQANQALAENRAAVLVDYLVVSGIAPNRLVARGYGERLLLNECRDGVPCREAQHAQNRRTELKILRLD